MRPLCLGDKRIVLPNEIPATILRDTYFEIPATIPRRMPSTAARRACHRRCGTPLVAAAPLLWLLIRASLAEPLRVLFVTHEPDKVSGKVFGSAVLRGHMMAEAVRKQEGVAWTAVAPTSRVVPQLAYGRQKVSACVFIKARFDLTAVRDCCALGAKVVAYDIIDDLVVMQELLNVAADRRAITRQSTLRKLMNAGVTHFVTSTHRLASAVNDATRAFAVPHQCNNVGRWGRVKVRDADTLRVAFLAGAEANLPPASELGQLADAACKANAQLVVLLQVIPPAKPGQPRNVLNTKATTWPCPPVEVRSVEKYSTRADAGKCGRDKWAQCVFHIDDAANDVDVAVLWPAPDGGRARLTAWNKGSREAQGERPANRLMWWWSRGVPTVVYPYASYVEAFDRVGYGQGVLEDAAALQIRTPEQLTKAIRMLRDARTRQQLADQGVRAAEDVYGLDATAALLAKELREAVAHMNRTCQVTGTRAGGGKRSHYSIGRRPAGVSMERLARMARLKQRVRSRAMAARERSRRRIGPAGIRRIRLGRQGASQSKSPLI